ncbi:hypothetical protein ANN_04894 [Periplaneta americana]|uniref:Uncharacterized protein n=1 Tax=Periplaneta americana TaxID=6978 RepID=A0ABQ8TAV0_PERAM|nr:hypothetical protein ANN_04894 [Periplaneta americana]
MSPGSSTESYPAFARIGLRENPGKNLNQVTCPDRDSNPGHLVSRPDALTVTPQNENTCFYHTYNNNNNNNSKAALNISGQDLEIEILKIGYDTSSRDGRSVGNVVIGTLEMDTAPKIFLLTTEVLDKVNHQFICKLFDKSITDVARKQDERMHLVLEKIQSVEQYLGHCARKIGQDISEKMKTVLQNKVDYQTMCKFDKILQRENFDLGEFVEDFSPGDVAYFKYPPMTSVEVKISFSVYKNVLQDNRLSFKFETLRMIMVLYCNAE